MHRQAMLVSLSLSPASTAAKNDKHWAFLDEIDAPQWADLKAEEALAKAGTIGDDPWFYHSHSHHEVPLTTITGGQASDVKDSNASVRTPNFERKKNRGSSKAKLAFDGGVPTVAKPKEAGNEDESPRRRFNDTFGGESPRVASPVHCKSPEKFLLARRFMSSATSDDYVAGKDGTGVLGNVISRRNIFENQAFNDQMSMENDMPVSAGQSAEDEEKVSHPWQNNLSSKLKDTSRLRKSLGSALRVKVDDSADNPNAKPSGKGTRPKSRLRQSVQLEAAALPEISVTERDTKKDTASLRNEDGLFIQTCLPDRISAGDANTGTGLENKLGVNSSVQAFDDIRKMRKSWGSALRVKVSDGSPVAELGSKDDVSPVRDEKRDCSPVQVNGTGVNLSPVVDTKGGSVEKKVLGVDLPEVVHSMERRAENPVDRRDALDAVQELGVSSELVAVAKKAYRRSVSFDNTQGRETGIKAPTSSRSNLGQQKQAPRASSVSRLNLPSQKPEKVSRLSKGGKENSSLHSISKTTKLNPEPATRSPRMSRQTVTRMSMPSLTYAAHARAAMGANGGTILKPSGNSVLDTNRSDSIKAAAAAAKKSVGGLDNGSRKKTEAIATNAPAKTTTRQSILRSSMPVFSAAKQGSKAVLETGVAAPKQGGKTSSKTGNGDSDLAALLAEHNRKFRPKSTYEPRMHSVKDIREWEARTGQLFYNLLPAERERANQEISAAKQTQMQRPK